MIFRVQMGFPYDSALPRDVVTVNPHFEGDNAQALLVALKANLLANNFTAAHPFTLKAYDALKAPPSYPLWTESAPGSIPNSGIPREVALCLSYYAGFNRPSFRGRLYLPGWWFGVAPNNRPSTAVQTACVDWSDVLTKNLPGGHWWSMYSPKRRSAAQVTHVWCDDEWDTVRSRGMKATARVDKQLI